MEQRWSNAFDADGPEPQRGQTHDADEPAQTAGENGPSRCRRRLEASIASVNLQADRVYEPEPAADGNEQEAADEEALTADECADGTECLLYADDHPRTTVAYAVASRLEPAVTIARVDRHHWPVARTRGVTQRAITATMNAAIEPNTLAV
ncbi:hypothetical protein D8S78_20785 [Natrialba swarupiae]|nr:hypothetical protein [Natrialba swarupiae]